LHWKPTLETGTGAGRSPDEDKGTDWKQALWQSVVWCRGFEGLKSVTGMEASWKEKIQEWADKIDSMEKEPDREVVGTKYTYTYPWMAGDLTITLDGL
jgi:hypothetical protein